MSDNHDQGDLFDPEHRDVRRELYSRVGKIERVVTRLESVVESLAASVGGLAADVSKDRQDRYNQSKIPLSAWIGFGSLGVAAVMMIMAIGGLVSAGIYGDIGRNERDISDLSEIMNGRGRELGQTASQIENLRFQTSLTAEQLRALEREVTEIQRSRFDDEDADRLREELREYVKDHKD